jgi:glycosyltransferase involved in cell wall biosynthesis
MTTHTESPLVDQAHGSDIGYIMKGYPRLTDVFINNEIYLLESMGLALQIFSAKKPAGEKIHSVVNNIQAPVTYLPEVTSISTNNFLLWLCQNLPHFISSQLYLCRAHFRSYIHTMREAVGMSFKYRTTFFSTPRKIFLQEFLQAGYIARQVLESGRIRHLHGHFCHGSTTITMFVSQLTGIPFSFTAHAKDIYLQKLNPSDLLSIKIRRAQFVVTCTEANSRYLKSVCPDVSTIHTIYHGLDTTSFTPAVHQHDDDNTVPVILSVGRFVEKKGFSYLVQACRILKDRGYAFQCRLLGEADDQTDLIKQLIGELTLEDTVFLDDPVTQEELTQIYRNCAIFALPCQILDNGDRDGIPNVLVEAMAMEIPVVSTDISGIPELIEHRVDGLLVPQKDASALAGALEELLRESRLRSELGKHGRDKVRRLFDNKATTLELRKLFASCLEKTRQRGADERDADVTHAA